MTCDAVRLASTTAEAAAPKTLTKYTHTSTWTSFHRLDSANAVEKLRRGLRNPVQP